MSRRAGPAARGRAGREGAPGRGPGGGRRPQARAGEGPAPAGAAGSSFS
jgi:hypothetical protein